MNIKSGIKKDTFYISAFAITLQGLGLLFNIYITRSLGTEAVGICSLIFSLYAFVIVFANGNIFTSTGRFVSEEIGAGGNSEKIMRYALTFGMISSLIVCFLLFIFAEKIASDMFGKSAETAVKMIAVSLPLATIGACIKGYFHARRMVSKPCISDVIEFSSKAVIVFIGAHFLIPKFNTSIFSIIALSLLSGELISCAYLVISYMTAKENSTANKTTINNIGGYIKVIFPIALNGYIFAILSGGNDIIVPVMLKKFSGSVERALSEYGIFEGIIMPVIFFPSIILQSLSLILVPEIAREKSAGNIERIQYLTKRTLKMTFLWSILIGTLLLIFGRDIGSIFCDDSLAGKTLLILCPVIPFIYMEIVLEGILKGLGKQNFSTINSAVEYILRISSVIIFIGKFGFYGILISYFVSNIFSDVVRLIVVLKETQVKLQIGEYIVIPLICAVISYFTVGIFVPHGENNIFTLLLLMLLTLGIYFSLSQLTDFIIYRKKLI